MIASKAQTTIPQAERTAVDVGPGNEIAYVIAKGHVVVTKAIPPRPPRPTVRGPALNSRLAMPIGGLVEGDRGRVTACLNRLLAAALAV